MTDLGKEYARKMSEKPTLTPQDEDNIEDLLTRTCEQCGATFPTYQALGGHMKTHGVPKRGDLLAAIERVKSLLPTGVSVTVTGGET